MTIVRLVRHAEPAAVVGDDPDLTDLGVAQAAALPSRLPKGVLVTSPLRRARSTARPLELAWEVDAIVERAVRELPSPTSTVDDRRAWLQVALRSTFEALGDEQREWRDRIVEFVASRTEDTVVVTHAVVVNAVVGHCVGDDRLWHMRPGHASVTSVEVGSSGAMTLVERGDQADSVVT